MIQAATWQFAIHVIVVAAILSTFHLSAYDIAVLPQLPKSFVLPCLYHFCKACLKLAMRKLCGSDLQLIYAFKHELDILMTAEYLQPGTAALSCACTSTNIILVIAGGTLTLER